jgi:hypothetical protein
MENPLNFKVYKGKSALRLNLVRPKDYSLGFIFAELANLKEITADKQRNYDWENNKLGVKLGFADITSIIYALEYGDSCDLFHEFNGTTTSIKLQRSEGGNSAYFFKVQKAPFILNKPTLNNSPNENAQSIFYRPGTVFTIHPIRHFFSFPYE